MKKSLLLCLLFFTAIQSQEKKNIVLTSNALRLADNACLFHGPIYDILGTRLQLKNFIQGEKERNGAVLTMNIHGSNLTLSTNIRRPEILFGATFVVVGPDHELLSSLIQPTHEHSSQKYIQTIAHESLYTRQMNSTNNGSFTGSYAINPINQELLPIYVSDYAVECFDIRHTKTRIGIPAHNSKDLEFARYHALPIKVVVTAHPYDCYGIPTTTPLIDSHGNLKQAYLGEYRECYVTNSGFLTDLNLKDAAAMVVETLRLTNHIIPHKEILLYSYNNQLYSIKDLTKIETALHKNEINNVQTDSLKEELKVILNYVQADFIELTEQFLINVNNAKALMISLIEESCALRENSICYLSRWSHLDNDESEKEAFRRDILTLREFTIFSTDLYNFLGDLAHSCPKALANLRNQSKK